MQIQPKEKQRETGNGKEEENKAVLRALDQTGWPTHTRTAKEPPFIIKTGRDKRL